MFIEKDGQIFTREEITTGTQKVVVECAVTGVYKNPATGEWEEVEAFTDKPAITADGLDAAIITAKVPTVLTEITFYHADTGEPITTVPVDPATHTATLQVTATTPGVVRIRAGEPTMTKLNEAVIIAQ